ncbi:MAG: hypothetical protein LBV41_04640 [Cytophagaceae bacterium]|jgi:hypothetical protein|nr:hypothetical protein [Cytophagaceae bacterium]
MSVLSELQIERITNTVNRSSIKSADLKEDLIDHLCCIVEDEMQKGTDFEIALQGALQRMCPDGLNPIQNETLFLLTSKSRKRIDNIVRVSGLIAITGVLATVIMKALHLPFAQLALLITVAVALLLFLPAIIVRTLKLVSGKKVFHLFGIAGVALLAAAALFALCHFPGVYILLLMGVICLYAVVFSMCSFKIFRKSH